MGTYTLRGMHNNDGGGERTCSVCAQGENLIRDLPSQDILYRLLHVAYYCAFHTHSKVCMYSYSLVASLFRGTGVVWDTISQEWKFENVLKIFFLLLAVDGPCHNAEPPPLPAIQIQPIKSTRKVGIW